MKLGLFKKKPKKTSSAQGSKTVTAAVVGLVPVDQRSGVGAAFLFRTAAQDQAAAAAVLRILFQESIAIATATAPIQLTSQALLAVAQEAAAG